MTKEEIIHALENKLIEICPDIATTPTEVKFKGEHRVSEWSRKIMVPKEKTQGEYLKDIFGISNTEWNRHYNEAISGSGEEKDKIMTLHSSSLLALLCFSNVSVKQPLTIDGIEYTKVWFEVKNRVFDNPSNIDVVLGNDSEDLLFLESKFTEYLTPSNSSFAKKYFEFYQNILPSIEGYPLRMVYPRKYGKGGGMGLEPSSDAQLYSHLHMNGIKQCFSHLIGLCQGPDKTSCLKWDGLMSKNRFATILFRFSGKEFISYRDFYSKTIGKITVADLKSAITPIEKIEDNYTDRIEIFPSVLTYQEVFKEFDLPRKVKDFYHL